MCAWHMHPEAAGMLDCSLHQSMEITMQDVFSIDQGILEVEVDLQALHNGRPHLREATRAWHSLLQHTAGLQTICRKARHTTAISDPELHAWQ